MKKETFSEKLKRLRNSEIYLAESLKVEFSLELNKLMKERGLNQKGLAEKVGKTEAYMTKVFSGNENFTIETMAKMVFALGGVLELKIGRKEGCLSGWEKNINKEDPLIMTKVNTGEVIQTLRELKNWTQKELAKRCGIGATHISLLENNRVEIGKRRAEQLAKAFGVHPAIIMFPEYEALEITKVA